MGSLAWKAPPQLPLGRLGEIELREVDPSVGPPPRPGQDRLGPLAVRGVDPLRDGRGWKITVQPLGPGLAVVPPLDLGDGRVTPELRITVPRTVPFGAEWAGVGGGREDVLPYVPFPWEWTTLLAIPLAGAAWLVRRRYRAGASGRRLRAARRAFTHHYPPKVHDRAHLDAAHAAGRNLLAARFGPEALAWGSEILHGRGLEPWATWVRALDAARFSLSEPALPPLLALLACLEAPK